MATTVGKGSKRKVYWSLGGYPQPDAKGNGGLKFGSKGGAGKYAKRMALVEASKKEEK